ncbi:chloride channel protein [Sulfuriferula nivalis]|uniref:Chloride channel protein n=1 Tax=Sulfuriferula nivalis TaxID=2675298 RepID=A0A809SEJ7_9PROT|nr:chloride channel protein [Sulfuriferula nivalis]BBP01487.1 chloride channel protein [Sulfuriferula nivalis]
MSVQTPESSVTNSAPVASDFEAKSVDMWHRGSAWILGPLLIGMVAVVLATASDYANELNAKLFHTFFLAPILIVPLGFVLLTYVSRRYFAGTQGSGIPQTIAAINEVSDSKTSYLLSLRIMIGKILLTVGGLAVGASIGREGPTVQVGASIMHMFYGRGPFQGTEQRRILLLAGGAAGIAAAFNTPLAGIMFAIEELSKHHVFNANSSSLVTVIVSGLIPLALLGNYTYFGSSGTNLEWDSGMSTILICGIVGGMAGGVFSRILLAVSFDTTSKLAKFIGRRPLAFAALCGLGVALLGLATDHLVFGTGYQPTRSMLEESGSLPWYFGIAKLLATLLSSMSGIAGGVFAPSLAVGAGIGDNLAALLPTSYAPHSAIVLLTMAAYLSGVTRAPVTAFIIMMEMTDSHHMLLPLMAASVVASAASKLISPVPLYHALSQKFIPPQ